MNTSGMLKLFVYGTLKRGYWNHDAFCQGVLDIRDAHLRGRLYEEPRFPLLRAGRRPQTDALSGSHRQPTTKKGATRTARTARPSHESRAPASKPAVEVGPTPD